MSVKATTWAWEQETRNAGQLLVLLAIADHASEHDDPDLPDGLIAWPKIATLATMTGFTYDTVRKNIASLVEDGLVEKVNRRVHGIRAGAWVLRLAVEARSESGSEDPVKSGSMDPVKSGRGGPVISPNIEPEESNPKDEPGDLVLAVDVAPAKPAAPSFDDWYAGYPKKQGKAVAEKAWKKLTADDKRAALAALPDWQAKAAAEGIEFIPMASTWMNQRRWLDEVTTVARRPVTVADRNAQALAEFKRKHAASAPVEGRVIAIDS